MSETRLKIKDKVSKMTWHSALKEKDEGGGETKYEAYEHKKDRIYMKKKKLQGQGFRL